MPLPAQTPASQLEPTTRAREVTRAGGHINSAARALDLLDTVAAEPGLTAKEITRRTGLQRATTYHHLATLVTHRYLTRDRHGRYVPGPRISDLYLGVRAAWRIPHTVDQRLRDATRATGYTHILGRLAAGSVTIAAAAEGLHPHADEAVVGKGDQSPTVAGARALLATLPHHELRAWLRQSRWLDEHGRLPRHTPASVTDADAFARELRQPRDGIHCEIETYRPSLGSAAALALDHPDPERRITIVAVAPAHHLNDHPAAIRMHLNSLAALIRDGLTNTPGPL